jgi:antiviral helicase SKI2
LNKENVTLKGIIASQINETNELLLTEMLLNNYFDNLKEEEIGGLLGIFLNSRCLDDENNIYNNNDLDINEKLKIVLYKTSELSKNLEEKEKKMNIYLQTEWELNYNMVEYSYKWIKGVPFNELYYDNYSGNFVKDMIKLDNIISTLEILSKICNKNNLYLRLKNIHVKILRDIVSNESLYIKL